MGSLVISGNGKVRRFALSGSGDESGAFLPGAGALCTGAHGIYCASAQDGAVWRLNTGTLMPEAIFAGGPDVTHMAVSPDGTRLYLLCAGADSVLMLDARSGGAQLLARAGLNPQQLTLDSSGSVLAVAGGMCGAVVLLCAKTLGTLACVQMPGPVYSALLQRGRICALCLSETLETILVVCDPNGMQRVQRLAGMPGVLACRRDIILAATLGYLYAATADGERLLWSRRMPGRADSIFYMDHAWILRDPLEERLYAVHAKTGARRMLAECARGAAPL